MRFYFCPSVALRGGDLARSSPKALTAAGVGGLNSIRKFRSGFFGVPNRMQPISLASKEDDADKALSSVFQTLAKIVNFCGV